MPDFASAGWAAARVSDAAASANAAVREIPRWVVRKRERMRARFVNVQPRQMSREFVAAVVLALLLAAGFAVYSWVHSGDPVSSQGTEPETSAAGPAAAEAAPEPPPDESEVATEPTASEAEDSTLIQASTTSQKPERNAPARYSSTARPSDREVPPATSAAGQKRSKTTRDSVRRPAVAYREDGSPEVTTEDPRIVARRARRLRERVVYQPPVSSIETIFTGVPAGRRGWRRRDW
jgi:hypothetical protein